MLSAFITLREGVKAALVAGIALVYLNRICFYVRRRESAVFHRGTHLMGALIQSASGEFVG